jgi:hypothetical protein
MPANLPVLSHALALELATSKSGTTTVSPPTLTPHVRR